MSWVADISFKGLGLGVHLTWKIFHRMWSIYCILWVNGQTESPSSTANCQNWFISNQSDISFHGWDLLQFPLWGHIYKNNISLYREMENFSSMVVDMVLPKTCHGIVYFVRCPMFIPWSHNKYSDLFRYMKKIIICFVWRSIWMWYIWFLNLRF